MTVPDDANPDAPSDGDLNPNGLTFEPTPDERNLALIAHLSGCAGVVGAGLVGFLGPLIIYVLKKDESTYVGSQAKEALNFQITIFLLGIACLVVTVLSCGFLFPVMFVPIVLQVVFSIVGALGSPGRVELSVSVQRAVAAVAT